MNSNKSFKVMLLCTGNTCRSAMAEGIARKVAQDMGVNNIEFSSSGTGAMDGVPATDYAVEAASHWDVDIRSHRSRLVNKEIVDDADLILAMGPEHVQQILAKYKGAASKIFLYKSFPEPYSPMQGRVEDPIGGTLEQYNQTFLELDEVMRRIFPKIVELAKTHE